jgi:hypothetical protein
MMFAVISCDAPSRSAKTDSAAASTQSTSAGSSAPIVSAVNPDSASACPHNGKWALCSLEKRLRQSGFVLKRVDGPSTRRAGFDVAPTVYTIGKARVEVFLYPDSASLARDIARIDTLTAGPRGAPSQWGEVPPVLARSANLAAVILTSSPRQAERFALAITAGAPQAGSPR